MKGCLLALLLLKSQEAGEQIILVIDGPATGKAEAFSQPEHGFKSCDHSARCVEVLEAAVAPDRATMRSAKLAQQDYTHYAANGDFRISRTSLTADSSVRTLTPPFAG